ncbi:hypothetical protein [Telluribacter sp.]|jgi:rhomboid protease GluP|uniref:hypothetical protein n=1 Tax=Telluribacter sp. TaxID=1978767 RepID=UPI002E0D150C|nr:hypothetical protein [Telluribacter sp.]
MAFGAPPRFTQEIHSIELPAEHFLTLAIEAIQLLDWYVGYKSESGLMAFTNASLATWSEEVTLLIEGKTIRLVSECTGSQLADWGKNKKNLARLLQKVEELRAALSPEAVALRYEALKPTLIPAQECVLHQPTPSFQETLTGLFPFLKATGI